MILYVDILLAVNWWIDYLLLLGVQRLTGAESRRWRLPLGALTGAAAALTVFLPPLPAVLSLLVKLPAAAAMVLIGFCWSGRRAFVRRLLWLFSLSAALAGVCGALYFFVAPAGFYVFNGVVYYSVPPLLLVGLTVLCYAALWLVERVLRRRAPVQHSFTVTVYREGQAATLSCLYDSGNHLTEPFSGRPVLVAERAALAALGQLPQGAEQLSRAGPGWRLIPFESLGGEGVLPAFLPQRITVRRAGKEQPLPPCYVAVCERLGRGEYRGLLGSALAEELTGGKCI